ncbi:hypothetical protein [Flavobacterium pallidum]|uniref:DUF2796 domain-containing protein n=1 Tax=Flavobacterium pallidum TaxID=2172098 RepID=A0A2S1SF00_9FLAO|nr:hypothetical protein [Flavobacterium pallidum]AWI24917.1 hypothetical protein HYN49_02850 [Flavobacterium pallidum]
MRALYFILSVVAFLSFGGNAAHAHTHGAVKIHTESAKTIHTLQQFTAADLDKNLFEDTDSDTDEDFSGTGNAKDDHTGKSFTNHYAVCHPRPAQFIAQKASGHTPLYISPAIIGHTSPIYITLRVLRI